MKNTHLADLLIRKAVINKTQLATAQENMKRKQDTFTCSLVKTNILTEDQLVKFISTSFGRPAIDLMPITIDPTLSKISIAMMKKNQVLPIARKDNVVTLAVVDPYDIDSIDEVSFISGLQVELMIARESALIAKLNGLMQSPPEAEKQVNHSSSRNKAQHEDHDFAQFEEAPVVKLVNSILHDAIKRRASDIHFEPYENILRVRYRIDGVLQEVMQPPLSMRDAIVSRLKIQAQLDITERRLPQDGRIKLALPNAESIDFRVSILPTLFGEKVVMRLLSQSNLQTDMSQLGYESDDLKKFQHAIHQPYGMVLVTGPTGSGKTVSLYSAVSELNQPNINICTAEDPVEFNFMGINQVNVNPAIGMDFPAALKSFLRQDPDVILIGELRDYDTASIGIKAALTGHMVLATLHTKDAPSTMTRLINIGIEPFLVGSAVNLVTAQRLGRRICNACAAPVTLDPQAYINAGLSRSELDTFTPMKGKGCSACNGTGYQGRIGIYQVMPVSDNIRNAVYANKNTDEINEIAEAEGVKTLRTAALNKVKEGILTLEESLRITLGD